MASYQVQPAIFPTRNTVIYWNGGIATTAAGEASTGMLGTLYPVAVKGLIDTNQSVDITSVLGWPLSMPFFTCRPVVVCLSAADAAWADYTITITYQNIFGLFCQNNDGDALTGDAGFQTLSTPTVTGTAPNPNLLLPQRLLKAVIKPNTLNPATPTTPLCFDIGSGGSTSLIQLQDSQRYWGTSIEVLTPLGALTDTISPYNAYITNLPQMALSNQNIIEHPLWDVFYGNSSISNPIGSSSILSNGQRFMFNAGTALLDADATGNTFISTQLLNSSGDVTYVAPAGNLYLLFEAVDDETTSDLLINVLQNGVSF